MVSPLFLGGVGDKRTGTIEQNQSKQINLDFGGVYVIRNSGGYQACIFSILFAEIVILSNSTEYGSTTGFVYRITKEPNVVSGIVTITNYSTSRDFMFKRIA